MSRAAAGAPIVVKPSNNIYTALAGIATLATLAAVIVVFTKATGAGIGWEPFKM